MLAAVMLRVCLAVGVGSGAVLMVLGVALAGWLRWFVALASVGVDASVVATGLAGISCGLMLVGVDDGSELAAAASSPPETGVGSVACCLWGLIMSVDGSVPVGSPPEMGMGSSSSLSDSYAFLCAMVGG